MANGDEVSKALGEVIYSLLNASSIETQQSEEFKKIVQYPALLSDPSNLHSQIFYPLNNLFGEAIIQTQEFLPEYSRLAKHVYLNHQFYHWQLRQVFSDFEGSACCADKARFVIRYFQKVAKGESEIIDKWCSESFARPKLNKPELWMNYINALCRLHSGNVADFLSSRQAIELEYK